MMVQPTASRRDDAAVRPPPKVLAAANAALRRASAAFNMDAHRFSMEIDLARPGVEVRLMFTPAVGAPFAQLRLLDIGPWQEPTGYGTLRRAVEELVWNTALAFRPSAPASPTGWSLHPVAAAIIANAGTSLPNPADPASWLIEGNSLIRLPDGGNMIEVAFGGQEGVLLLRRAIIVDNAGVVQGALIMDGHRLMVRFEGAYPEMVADALPGRTADALCNVFASDPRGAKAVIASARNLAPDEPCMVVEFEDRLVPLLTTTSGKERWRPRKAVTITGRPMPLYRRIPDRRKSVVATNA